MRTEMKIAIRSGDVGAAAGYFGLSNFLQTEIRDRMQQLADALGVKTSQLLVSTKSDALDRLYDPRVTLRVLPPRELTRDEERSLLRNYGYTGWEFQFRSTRVTRVGLYYDPRLCQLPTSCDCDDPDDGDCAFCEGEEFCTTHDEYH